MSSRLVDDHRHDWQPAEVILGAGGELVEVCAVGWCGAVAFVPSGAGGRESLPPPRD